MSTQTKVQNRFSFRTDCRFLALDFLPEKQFVIFHFQNPQAYGSIPLRLEHLKELYLEIGKILKEKKND